MNSSVNYSPLLCSMQKAAETLGIPKLGSINLYWHLKRLGIVDRYNIPRKEYCDFGFLTIGYGTKNPASASRYPKTLVTQTGLAWLQETIAPEIRTFNSNNLKN